MKRKLALLLAAVMMISLLPMNAFAASRYDLSRSAAGVSKGTLLYEEGLGLGFSQITDSDYVSYRVEGSNLIITLSSTVKAGDTIKLTLDNAKWYFRSKNNVSLTGSSSLLTETSTAALKAEEIKNTEKSSLYYLVGHDNIFVQSSTKTDITKAYFLITEINKNFAAIKDAYDKANGSSANVQGAYNSPEKYYMDYEELVNLLGGSITNANDLGAATTAVQSVTWYVASTYNGAANSAYAHINWPTIAGGTITNSATRGFDVDGPVPGITYDTSKGLWVSAYSPTEEFESGTYFRYGRGITVDRNGDAKAVGAPVTGTTGIGTAVAVAQLPYAMSVDTRQDNVATLTVLETINNAGIAAKEYVPSTSELYQIVVPLVSLTKDANTDVRVIINDDNNVTGISSVPIRYGMTGGATVASIASVVTARDAFALGRITIKETRLNSIKNGTLRIAAMDGFEFAHYAGSQATGTENFNVASFSDVKVGVVSGLAWKKADGTYKVGEGTQGTDYTISYAANTTNVVRQGGWVWVPAVKADGTLDTNADGTAKGSFVWYTGDTYAQFASWNRSAIVVNFMTLEPTTRVFGSVELTGLRLVPSDYQTDYVGDITLSFNGDDGYTSGVSSQTGLVVAKRADWLVNFSAASTPTLVSGRYHDTATSNAGGYHRTGDVTFEENISGAWWGGRQVVFQLSDNAKFRAVYFSTVDNVVGANFKEQNILNQGNKYAYYGNTSIMLDDNTLAINNLQISTNNKLKLVMRLWVSVEAGSDGPVELTLADSTETTRISNKTITIANAVPPVDVEVANVTELNVGYQTINTADITIKERAPGYLLAGENVKLSLTDGISNDGLYFDETLKVEVVSGDGTVKNPRVVSNATYASTSLVSDTGSIYFEVGKASSKEAMTIKVSNAAVKVNRSVPESNARPYDVVIWGSAIAKNFYNTANAPRDTFATPGIRVPYLAVKTPAQDRNTVFSQVVRVTDGDSIALVDGAPYDMEDTAPYVSTKSNSMMVPLRFVSYAFGLSKDSVLWDGKSETATVIHPTKVIQFKKDSDTMWVDGAAIPMRSPDNLPVYAEITNDRIYIPFRMLGNAFGVSVSWEADTRTAVYNAPTAVAAE